MEDELVRFVQKALIVKGNKILLIKKSEKDFRQPNRWEVAGGGKMMGETLEEHIIREVKEELGITIVPKELFDMWEFVLTIDGKKVTNIAIARFCEIPEGENFNITEDVIAECKWVEINDDLLKYDFVTGIKNTMKKFVEFYKSKK